MSILSFIRNKHTWRILLPIIVCYALYIIYEPYALGFNWENVVTLVGSCVPCLIFFQYICHTNLWNRSLWARACIGLLWAITFPQLYHWSYQNPFYFYQFANDYLFGLFYFIGATIFLYVFGSSRKVSWLWTLIVTVFDWLLTFIPLAEIAYYISIWHCLTPNTLMALYMTNPSEAFEFVQNLGGIGGIIALVIGAIVWFAILYLSNRRYIRTLPPDKPSYQRAGILLLSLLFIPIAAYDFYHTCIVSNWNEVRDYMKQLQQYDTLHQGIYKSLDLYTKKTSADTVPGTIIVVIGESSSRNYMKVYNQHFDYDDTPWQDEMSHNPNFIFFNHAYSSYVQTVPTLERALTERNQYNDKPFLASSNILDVARKAGYHTTWLSNQGVYGQYDTAISLIAKTAQTPKWAHESYVFTDKYDEALLPLLKIVNPNVNNFLVIHIMGSHIYYNDRYPHRFSKWKKGDAPSGKEAYANSQLYTDWLLEQIFNYGKEHLHLQAMVYFSDHGESLKLSHNPDVFDFDMTRIPFWVYLSPQYQKEYPKTYDILLSREHTYFTNDLLYDFLSGLMHAPSNRYDASRDFSNEAYRFNRNNLTTMLGTQPLTNDPDPDMNK